jgi:hypothetical protein
MPCFDEVCGHRAAHVAEADEGDGRHRRSSVAIVPAEKPQSFMAGCHVSRAEAGP